MELTIEKLMEDYFNSWNEGFISKNSEGIRSFMSRDFTGYWGHSGLTKPQEYGYDYDLDAVLVNEGSAYKSFDILSVTERGNGQELIVFGKETNMINGQAFPAQCLFVWRKEATGWKLLREYIELIK